MVRSQSLAKRACIAAALFAIACGSHDDTTAVANRSVLTAVTVSLSQASIAVGQTTTAGAIAVDQNGASIGTGTVAWTSNNTSIATVAATGVVTGIGAGVAVITGTAQSVAGQATLTVTNGAPTSGSVVVALAQAGQSAALLDSPSSTVSLAMPAGAQYLIGVVNTDNSSSITEDFTLNGGSAVIASRIPLSPPIVGSSKTRTSSPLPSLTMSQPFATTASLNAISIRSRADEHLSLLDDNRRLFASRGNPSHAWATHNASAGRVAPLSDAIAPAIGRVNKVYVKHSVGGSCTAVDSIGARTVAVGQHVIVLADTDLTRWPQTYRPDSAFYQTFADEYDQVTYPHIIANIGDPLAYDHSLSSAGKVTVTITPVLNNFKDATGGGVVVAFVNGCDFFPYAATGANADFSNQTEMFYSWVPAPNADGVTTWEEGLRATAAHESKHLVSYADRIINDSPSFEEIWLEEGLAQESAEIWERQFSQATLKGGATFTQTVACEINLGANAPCDLAGTKPLTLVASHLPFFFDYLQAESASHNEGLGIDTPSNYGAGWAFARWSTDQFGASGEGTFIKSLVNESKQIGLANLSLHTGQPATTLLVYWNMAAAIFQTPSYTLADVRLTTPSFNFADIFNVGQTALTCSGVRCGLFTQSGTPVFPVQPIALASGAFTNTVTGVPGTSGVFYLLTASTASTQTLHLTGGAGGELPSSSGLRLAVLRVQ
ncbi:MAG TPA: Ig-like domain-containing protein [Gemmatimonadaceae bacterium]|jgi:hypothetical protein